MFSFKMFFYMILLLCLHVNIIILASSSSSSSITSTSGYTLGIRDSIMIAHSFNGKEFGPAQNMHGATYTVDVDFIASSLVTSSNWVIDIGLASDMLHEILLKYNFKNLNELFPNENTTTEFMCNVIHKDLCLKLKEVNYNGSLQVKLHESHKAWASYCNIV